MKIQSYQQALLTDVTLARSVKAGLTMEQIIVTLINQKQEMLEKIIALDSIAPRRIRVGNQEFIYRCPDHLIPATVVEATSVAEK